MRLPVVEARWQLEPGYRIELFTGQDEISREQVISTWLRERVMSAQEAERRAQEMLLVGIDPRGALAGVSTAYVQRSRQLRADFWHVRVFVPAAHRQSNMATMLAMTARVELEEWFTSGSDRRGIGAIMEVEHVGLQRHFPEALWSPTDYLFINEDSRGAHVRVHYFGGALAPEPDEGHGASY